MIHKLPAAVALIVSAAAICQAQQQSTGYEGVWTGKVGNTTVDLQVRGTRGKLTLTCQGYPGYADISVSADGVISGYGKTGSYRRTVSGHLPDFTIGEGGNCGGTGELQRK